AAPLPTRAQVAPAPAGQFAPPLVRCLRFLGRLNLRLNQGIVDLSRFTIRRLPQYGHCIQACNSVNRVLGITSRCRVQSNRTGPASRQLQDKVGGVAPAGLSPNRATRCCSCNWCPLPQLAAGSTPMKNIAYRLLRVWQRSQPASNTQVAVMAENRDRSSMADFVRILQACDRDRYGRS